jgi:hypothetical protein
MKKTKNIIFRNDKYTLCQYVIRDKRPVKQRLLYRGEFKKRERDIEWTAVPIGKFILLHYTALWVIKAILYYMCHKSFVYVTNSSMGVSSVLSEFYGFFSKKLFGVGSSLVLVLDQIPRECPTDLKILLCRYFCQYAIILDASCLRQGYFWSIWQLKPGLYVCQSICHTERRSICANFHQNLIKMFGKPEGKM